MSVVIRTEGLTQALRRDARARRARPRRSRRARSTATSGPTARARRRRSGCCSGCTARAPGSAELFGIDAWRDPVAAHRRVAYVAGEPFLWPSLTGAGDASSSSRACTAAPTSPTATSSSSAFELDTAQEDPGAVEGQPPEGAADRGASPRRADLLLLDEPTSGLDPLMEMAFRETHRARPSSAGRPCSSPRTSSARSRRSATASGSSGTGGSSTRARSPSCATSARRRSRSPSPAPLPELPALAGRRRSQAPGRTRCASRSRAAIGPLIAALAEHPVGALTSREPSLEEIFLHHYDGSDGACARG